MAVSRLATSKVTDLKRYASMLGGNAAYLPGDYESIATVTGTTASTISFTSIPSTFKHLQIRMLVKTSWTPGTVADGIRMRVNSDTGSKYRGHAIYAQGAGGGGVGSALGTYMNPNDFFLMACSTNPADNFGVSVIDILDYKETTKKKTVRALTSVENDGYYTGNFNNSAIASAVWLDTGAITSLELYTGSASGYNSLSHFALYGLKG